jgi:hypothetical protein
VVNCWVTHQAQNSRHCAEVIKDWVDYILDQNWMLNVPDENIVNFDAMNADFIIRSESTLDTRGIRSISVLAGKSSQRATVFMA